MEEEGSEKWTEEQLAETMMEFSGKGFPTPLTIPRKNAHGRLESHEARGHPSSKGAPLFLSQSDL